MSTYNRKKNIKCSKNYFLRLNRLFLPFFTCVFAVFCKQYKSTKQSTSEKTVCGFSRFLLRSIEMFPVSYYVLKF